MNAVDITIHFEKQQIDITEKALIAYNIQTGKVYSIGSEAEKYVEIEGVEVLPLYSNGKISDYMATCAFIKALLARGYEKIGRKSLFKQTVGICTGIKLNEVERKAIEECMIESTKPKNGLLISELRYEKFLEQAELFPEINKPEIMFEIGPVSVDIMIEESINTIMEIAKQQNISKEIVSEKIQTYLRSGKVFAHEPPHF